MFDQFNDWSSDCFSSNFFTETQTNTIVKGFSRLYGQDEWKHIFSYKGAF